MLVSKLLENLSYGELSNLSLSGEGSGEILEAKRPKIIKYANDGLLRLFSRFVLDYNELLLEQQSFITDYRLTRNHSSSNTERPVDAVPYILDTAAQPFREDIIKIIDAYGVGGHQYPLNDSEKPNSLFTPQPTTLQVPYPVQGALLSVIYQAKHVELAPDDLTAEIDLPEVLHEALSAYIAYKVFSHMNGQENAVKAAEHLANYESICGSVIENDLVNSSRSTTNERFQRGGWR